MLLCNDFNMSITLGDIPCKLIKVIWGWLSNVSDVLLSMKTVNPVYVDCIKRIGESQIAL